MRKQIEPKVDPFVERVRRALNKQKGNWPTIATSLQKKNSRLSYRWILAFASKQIIDPSFTRVRLLGSHLGVNIAHVEDQPQPTETSQ